MLSYIPALVALTQLFAVDVSAECTKFVTSGSTSAVYDYYRFFDFRNLDNHSGGDGRSSGPNNRPLKAFSSVPWNEGWERRYWDRPASGLATVNSIYSPDQISSNGSYLTLHTTRLENGTQLAAELGYKRHPVLHTSMRMSARVRGDYGAIAGFFTYYDDTDESDIEILTRDPPNRVHFSNQPTENPETGVPISGSTFNDSMPGGRKSSDWNTYRLDWVPNRSAWYFNGQQVAQTSVNVPKAASEVTLNLWSNGGRFSSVMNPGGNAYFDIQWVELLFNVSGTSTSRNGGDLCSPENALGSPTPVALRSNISHSTRKKAPKATLWWVVFFASLVSLITPAV